MPKADPRAIAILREFVSRYDSQHAAAETLGVSSPFMAMMLAGKRHVPDWILASAGYRRVTKTTIVKSGSR